MNNIETKKSWLSNLDSLWLRHLIVAGCLFVIVFLHWVPYGLNVPPTYEEWLGLFSIKYEGIERALQVFGPERPLLNLANILGYYISPSEFVGINFIQILSIGGAAYFLYLILHRLTGDELFSLFGAALFIVFPADVGRYTLRVVSLNLAVFVSLIAAYIAVRSIDSRRTISLLAFSIGLQLLSIKIYDGGLFVLVLWAFVLYWAGLNWRLALLWAVAPVVSIGFLAYSALFGSSYQSGILDSSVHNTSFAFSAMFAAIDALRRLYFAGWINFKEIWLFQNSSLYIIRVIIIIFFCLVASSVLIVRPRLDRSAKFSSYLHIAIVSGFLALVAYAIYIPSVWRDSSWRVFIFSSVGASVSIVALIRILFIWLKFSNIVFSIICTVFVAFGFLSTSGQHASYVSAGEAQVSMVEDVLRITQSDSTKRVVLFTANNAGAFDRFSTCTWASQCLNASANYINSSKLSKDYYICTFGVSAREICDFSENGINIAMNSPWQAAKTKDDVFLPYNNTEILVFENGLVKKLSDFGDVPSLMLQDGFYHWEGDPKDGHVWSSGVGKIIVFNRSNAVRELSISFKVVGAGDRGFKVTADGVERKVFNVSNNSASFLYDDIFFVNPGVTRINIETDKPPALIGDDTRPLAFYIRDINVYFTK